jgi:hypothetical protein
MRKQLGKCKVILSALLVAAATVFVGCTEVEGDHYENAISQERKYQEQVSDAKSNDREVEQDLEDILDEVGEVKTSEEVVAPATETKEAISEEVKAEVESKNLKFRKKKYLDEHYEKHGIEMGFESAEDYLAAANAVVVNPNALHKKEKEDNDDVYYVEETNEFVIVSDDGYIRTYFCPSAGIDYYNRQ